MFKSKIFYLFLVLIIGGGLFFYKKYGFHRKVLMPTYTMESKSNLFGNLEITSGILDSRAMANSILCIENSDNFSKLDLFMPDMGHGSAPPKVTEISIPSDFIQKAKTVSQLGCFSVEGMQLFMPGLWQVRVFYKDDTIGLFNLNLKK